jgi:hypothetical protein
VKRTTPPSSRRPSASIRRTPRLQRSIATSFKIQHLLLRLNLQPNLPLVSSQSLPCLRSLLTDMANRTPSLMVVPTTDTRAPATLRTLRASTILSLLMVIPRTLTAAAHNMHLALPRPPMLLAVPMTHRATTDITRRILLSIGDFRAQLLSNQCGMRLLTRHQLQALSRRIAPPHPLRQDIPPLPSPPWSLSKYTNFQLWRLTCIPACLHLIETRAWLMFSFLVRRYPDYVSFTLSQDGFHVEA